MASRKKFPGDGHRAVEEVKRAVERRLFIGRLPSEVTESELRAAFLEFGDITECRLVKKEGPGKTVAFLSFATWASAHAALKATDGLLSLQDHSEGQTLVASFAERSGHGRGGGAQYAKGLNNSRIFVGGMPENVSDDDLRGMFERFGRIEGVNLLTAKGTHRCGFVNYSLWGEALDAIEAMDNSPCPGSTSPEEVLTVVMADPKPGHGPPERDAFEGSSAKRRRLDDYGHSDPSSKRAEFERIKSQYLAAVEGSASEQVCSDLHWNLMSVRAAWSPTWGGRSGSGAGASWSEGSWSGAGGRAGNGGSTRRTTSSGGHSGDKSSDPRVDPDAARLFVGGLPYEVTDEELTLLIQQLRLRGLPSETELLECRVLPGKGCGYVRFASWTAAEEAFQALDERTVNGWKLPLRAKWAVPKPGGGDGGGRGGSRGSDYALERSGAAPRSRRDSGGSGEVERQRLFVGQLQRGARRQDVAAIFEPFGEVEEVKYLEDKGVAYVTYRDEGSAQQACEGLNGQEISGISRGEGLNVQFAKQR